MNDIIKTAITKLTDELAAFKGDRYGEAVKNELAEALMDFCNKSEDFSRIIAEDKRTLSDCAAKIMKGCGSCISDIEVYRRAVQFYCPDANVSFDMVIELPGKPAPVPKAEPAPEKPARTGKLINIFDIL